MKQKLLALRARSAQLAVAAGSVVVAGAAHAELPTEVGAAFTTISTNYTDLSAAAWPIVGTVVGGFILLKLFKKFANKAT